MSKTIEKARELAEQLRAIESRSKGQLLKRAADLLDELSDPVHAAGGTYCHECVFNIFGLCSTRGLRQVKPDGFCDAGKREI